MELAAAAATKPQTGRRRVKIDTAHGYVCNPFLQDWPERWQTNGRKNNQGEAVRNGESAKTTVTKQPLTGKNRPESATRQSMRHQLKRNSPATGRRDRKKERTRTRQRLKVEPEREDIRAGHPRKRRDIRGIYPQ